MSPYSWHALEGSAHGLTWILFIINRPGIITTAILTRTSSASIKNKGMYSYVCPSFCPSIVWLFYSSRCTVACIISRASSRLWLNYEAFGGEVKVKIVLRRKSLSWYHVNVGADDLFFSARGRIGLSSWLSWGVACFETAGLSVIRTSLSYICSCAQTSIF